MRSLSMNETAPSGYSPDSQVPRSGTFRAPMSISRLVSATARIAAMAGLAHRPIGILIPSSTLPPTMIVTIASNASERTC